ncbi:RNA 2',3'-cyclic phosphodiesterase [Desulfocurvibacter africanus]|uniref:RNA 2',3'-cyclic phosphodiesterase n=1 Tax=Desulfocurvibacter africanus subsp. africanus str. Walvis Bay TaxID=690850 RepID=F3Z346_DESAF|nr:RNA 2',3'-cyclic phosphodiesterase [Desulfocurvibacter africanus]EGJ50290.1 2'-5' RNA ligase [Desulfocurvibacter africanus subsp. africanus str. Walvis Bay]
MRLFIGIPLPEEYQQGLARLRDRLGSCVRSKLGWTRQGNWHMTLKFLGEVDEELARDVGQALAGLCLTPFTLQAAGAGFFPNLRKPRVFWVGLARGGEECAQWAAMVEDAMEPLGFAREERDFRPHLTLARVKEARRDDWAALMRDADREEWPAVRVEGLVLWQSKLGPGGPAYEALCQVKASQAGSGRGGS